MKINFEEVLGYILTFGHPKFFREIGNVHIEDKFDPETLQPFDKVLVRGDSKCCFWKCSLYSHYDDSYKYTCCGRYKYCIPYNEETEHLIGTSNEAPEYYRYWEENECFYCG